MKALDFSSLEERVMNFMGKAANGLRAGEILALSAHNTGKSFVEHALTVRMLKERKPSAKADVFWIDDYLCIGDPWVFWDGKFRKLFSKEVLDAPDTIQVEWANFIIT